MVRRLAMYVIASAVLMAACSTSEGGGLTDTRRVSAVDR